VNDCFYCLVDLHSLTAEIPDPETLRTKTLEAAAVLLAVGIDP
jgi:tryptophanyl-tRNA synthetase